MVLSHVRAMGRVCHGLSPAFRLQRRESWRGMRSENLDDLLSALVEHDPDRSIDLELAEPVPWGPSAALDTSQVDDLLREGLHQGVVDGQRQLGDGRSAWWSLVSLTVDGLRRLGQWPPAGGEHLPGPWDEGVWGTRDHPLLSELDASPPHADFLMGPEGQR